MVISFLNNFGQEPEVLEVETEFINGPLASSISLAHLQLAKSNNSRTACQTSMFAEKKTQSHYTTH